MKCPKCGTTINTNSFDVNSPEALLIHIAYQVKQSQNRINRREKCGIEPSCNAQKTLEKWQSWYGWVEKHLAEVNNDSKVKD